MQPGRFLNLLQVASAGLIVLLLLWQTDPDPSRQEEEMEDSRLTVEDPQVSQFIDLPFNGDMLSVSGELD